MKFDCIKQIRQGRRKMHSVPLRSSTKHRQKLITLAWRGFYGFIKDLALFDYYFIRCL